MDTCCCCCCCCCLVTSVVFSPMECSLPGSSVHGILQVRILEWVAMSSFRGSSQPGNWSQVSFLADSLPLCHQGSPLAYILTFYSSFAPVKEKGPTFINRLARCNSFRVIVWTFIEQQQKTPSIYIYMYVFMYTHKNTHVIHIHTEVHVFMYEYICMHTHKS